MIHSYFKDTACTAVKGYGAGLRRGVSPYKTLSRSTGTSIFATFLKTPCAYTQQGKIIVNKIPPHFFFALDGKFPGLGTRAVKFPGLGTKKEGKCPVLRQHSNIFSLIAQSNSAVLSILVCDFLFQLTSSFITAL